MSTVSLTSIERGVQMLRLSELKWAAAALIGLLLTAVFGCSAEPELLRADGILTGMTLIGQTQATPLLPSRREQSCFWRRSS